MLNFDFIAYPSVITALIFLSLTTPLVYLFLKWIERRLSVILAERVSKILLFLPLFLGILAGLNELTEYRKEREQLRDALRQTDLDNSISIAMAALSDIARQHLADCQRGRDLQSTTKLLISGLMEVHQDLQNTHRNCAPLPRSQCGSLINLARNTLIWSAAPSHASEFREHCDVKRTTEFVRRYAFVFDRLGDRGRMVNVSARLRNLPIDLDERATINAKLSSELSEKPIFRLVGFWLLVFAAAVEIVRIIRDIGGHQQTKA